MDELTVNIFNIVGNPFCVDANDGDLVYEQVKKALSQGKKVKLSFQNVEMLTSAFLNAAIGQLYRDFSETHIKASVSTEDFQAEDKALLRRVVQTAKLFFKDKDRLQRSIQEIMDEE